MQKLLAYEFTSETASFELHEQCGSQETGVFRTSRFDLESWVRERVCVCVRH